MSEELRDMQTKAINSLTSIAEVCNYIQSEAKYLTLDQCKTILKVGLDIADLGIQLMHKEDIVSEEAQ